MITYADHFPGFPAGDWPAVIPAGFIDSSSSNDACPSISDDAKNLQIYIDWADPTERELGPNASRFFVLRFNPEIDLDPETLLATEDWNEVLTFIENL